VWHHTREAEFSFVGDFAVANRRIVSYQHHVAATASFSPVNAANGTEADY
jgi:hypothetical protein